MSISWAAALGGGPHAATFRCSEHQHSTTARAAPAAAPPSASLPSPSLALPPFELERFFAKYEFTAQFQLCNSDSEPLAMSDLLASADADSLERWNSLRLYYTETQVPAGCLLARTKW